MVPCTFSVGRVYKLNILRKVNFTLAFIGIGLGFTHFFIEEVRIPIYLLFFYLTVMFLLSGIAQVKDKQYKSGYFYIGAVVVMSLAFIL
jgi:hypothetical protein